MEDEVVAAAIENPDAAPIAERLKAALALAEAMTLRPAGPFAKELARARAAGLDDAAIEDVANVVFHFNYINRVADAFDFELPQADRVPVLAKMLDAAKRFASGHRAEPSTVVTDEGLVRPVEVQNGRIAMLTAEATLPAQPRVDAEAFAAGALGAQRPEVTIAEPLRTYLDKLARHAYRITDEDVEALFAAGYDKDAIYELTQAGAIGAAVVGLESLLGEMAGKRPTEAAAGDTMMQ